MVLPRALQKALDFTFTVIKHPIGGLANAARILGSLREQIPPEDILIPVERDQRRARKILTFRVQSKRDLILLINRLFLVDDLQDQVLEPDGLRPEIFLFDRAKPTFKKRIVFLRSTQIFLPSLDCRPV